MSKFLYIEKIQSVAGGVFLNLNLNILYIDKDNII